MPGESGVTVVTMLVCFFILHARLRVHRAPGIPCAPIFSGRKIHAQLGRIASRDRGGVLEIANQYFAVIARSEATKQSTLSSLRNELLRSARNDDGGADCFAEAVIGRAWRDRWLATRRHCEE